jgi:hypothetical protein
VELFVPQLVGKIALVKTCAPGETTGVAAESSPGANTGVTAAQYGNGSFHQYDPQGTADQLTQLQAATPTWS